MHVSHNQPATRQCKPDVVGFLSTLTLWAMGCSSSAIVENATFVSRPRAPYQDSSTQNTRSGTNPISELKYMTLYWGFRTILIEKIRERAGT